VATEMLTTKSLRKIRRDLSLPIQLEKLKAHRDWVAWGQDTGYLPENDLVVSYVTSTNQNNRYIGVNNFQKNMKKSYAKNWNKRFIIVGDDRSWRKQIAEAALWARTQIHVRTLQYPKGVSSGHLKSMITPEVNGVRVENPRNAILNSDVAPIYEISNYAEYGSTAEARAFYSSMNGIIYYVANRVQRKFPALGVFFYYAKAQDRGLDHIYDVPVLRIAAPEDATGKWSKPGDRIRRRLKAVRSINRRLKGGT